MNCGHQAWAASTFTFSPLSRQDHTVTEVGLELLLGLKCATMPGQNSVTRHGSEQDDGPGICLTVSRISNIHDEQRPLKRDGCEEHEIAKKPLRILILFYGKSRTDMSRG